MIPRYAARWLWMRAGPFWSGGGSVLLLVRRAKPSLRVGNWRVGFQTTNLESRVTSDTAQYGYVLRAKRRIDDHAGRLAVLKCGLTVVGTLGLLERASVRG